MSTRYVWGKYKIVYALENEIIKEFRFYKSGIGGPNPILVGYVGQIKSPYFGDETSDTPIKLNFDTEYEVKEVKTMGYFTGGSFAFSRYNFSECFGRTDYSSSWYIREYGGGGSYNAGLICIRNSDISDDNNAYIGKELDIRYAKQVQQKGGYIESVSSDSAGEYPTDSAGGVSGGYFYLYKGSDNIDPTAISYPSAQVRPGDSITVTVSPRPNTYGGTVSYLYQYSINGGAWTDIQTTTAASVNFTVPAGAKSIQFRARAQDDMGFTSTTYVTGAAVTLERLNLWIGVNGRARKGAELYVGVNGKARKVTAAYIGVNGKARRFL